MRSPRRFPLPAPLLVGLLATGALAAAGPAAAASAPPTLESLSSRDSAAGLKSALSQGIDRAVAHLGSPEGFLADPKFTIPLPPVLEKADRAMRLVGLSGDADGLKEAINRAAGLAVAESKPVFAKALKSLTLADAKSILTGGDDAATRYFQQATQAELATRFRPIVARATEKVRLGSLYDRYAGQAAQLGLIRAEDANLNDYVTSQALAGLFRAIGDEERAIRADPLGQASSLLRKVFGAAAGAR
jgi:hypothetical protein